MNGGDQWCNVSQKDEVLIACGMQSKCNITLAYRTIVSISIYSFQTRG